MKKIFAIIILIMVSGCAGTYSSSTPASGKNVQNQQAVADISNSERDMIQFLEEEGRLLYEKDYFGALGSDIFLSNSTEAQRANVLGWLTKRDQSVFVVSFYKSENNGTSLSVAADITFQPNQKPILQILPGRPVSQVEMKQFRARQTALNAGVNNCSKAFNTIVIPQLDQTFRVYVLAATSDPDSVMVGGHSRILVANDGTTVIDVTPFSKSCLVLNKHPDNLPEGTEIQGLFVTHVLDDLPTPAHVYLSILHNINLFVVTSTSAWSVNKGKISLIERNNNN